MSSRAFVFAPLIFVLTTAFALTACQQAAWKAGASADDFKRDEQSCRAQTCDAATTQQCLRDKGWAIADLSAQGDDTPEEPTAAPLAKPATAPLSDPVSQKPSPQISASQPAPAVTTNTTKAATNIESAPAITPVSKKPATDPLQKQSVQTWWKAGAQSADFHVDADACLQQLGEEHTPNYAAHLYTRALVSCLQGRGWYAGANAVYKPLR